MLYLIRTRKGMEKYCKIVLLKSQFIHKCCILVKRFNDLFFAGPIMNTWNRYAKKLIWDRSRYWMPLLLIFVVYTTWRQVVSGEVR